MNYIPFVAWNLCPGGTTTQVANYYGSWGLMGALNEVVETVLDYLAIPTMPIFPTLPSFIRHWFL